MKRQIRVLCALLLIVAALAAFLLVPGAASPVMIVPAATRSLAQRAASAVARLTNWMPVDYAAKNDSMHIELLRLATEGGIDLAHDPGNRVVSVESGSPESVDVPCRAAFDEDASLEYDVADTRVVTSVSPLAQLAGHVHESQLGRLICEFAQRFVGYRYIYGAQNPSYGFDCSGLMYYVYGQFGYSINRGATGQLANGRYIRYSELQPGDLVFFGSGSVAFHVGMYIGGGRFVHAANSRQGVIISSLSESYYARNYMTARRIVN